MTKQAEIKDPPTECPFCKSERCGIQEGKVIFYCGTFIQYEQGCSCKKVKQSQECQKKLG